MFVNELYDAYLKYYRTLNLKTELLHDSDGHKILKIIGPGAGKAFLYLRNAFIEKKIALRTILFHGQKTKIPRQDCQWPMFILWQGTGCSYKNEMCELCRE